jgi:uncharacterized protein (DUF2235 family)
VGRNIVVFADGTGNSASKPFKTNVWRLYQALDLGGPDQIASFDDGVGTSSFKPLRILGLAVGVGVKRNVIDLYKFICRNYAKGDRIYAFGFSRGAFTVRVLNGLIHREGLVVFESEEELDRAAVAAYRAYRAEAFPASYPNLRWPPRSWVAGMRWLRDRLPRRRRQAGQAAQPTERRRGDVPLSRFWVTWGRGLRDVVIRVRDRLFRFRPYAEIRAEALRQGRGGKHGHETGIEVAFLGVWDTVAAYGLPIEELTQALDWVWPTTFCDRMLPGNVICARQALSLDDERQTFFPIPWDESAAQPRIAGSSLRGDRLVQVWFAGVHANVGGGYPDDGLAHVPLCWMIEEAAARGLRFKKWVVAGYAAIATDSGRIYDSRAGTGASYRYHPRDARLLMNGNRAEMGAGVIPLVDASVVLRMAYGKDGYAPISLPGRVDVLAPDGTIVPLARPPAGASAGPAIIADRLPLPRGEARDCTSRNEELRRAVLKLADGLEAKGRDSCTKLVLDTVWWRRVVYFATLFLALLAALYPLLGGYVHSTLTENVDKAAGAPLSALVALARGFVPGFAEPWLSAVAIHPTIAALIVVGILLSLRLSAFLQTRIRDRARVVWGVQARQDPRLAMQRNGRQKRIAAKAALFSAMASAAVFLGSRELTLWPALLSGTLAAAALGFFALFLWRTWRPQDSDAGAPGPLLGFARGMRSSGAMRGLYHVLSNRAFPAVVFAGSVLLILFLANRAAFDVWNSAGYFCKERKGRDWVTQAAVAREGFTTDQLCWDSGLTLVEGARYRIWLELPPGMDWFDRTTHTDVGGFPTDGIVHYSASLMKRWWGQNWFKPIARIGEKGNDEYVLDSIDPLPSPKSEEMQLTGQEAALVAAYERDRGADRFARIDEAAARNLTERFPRGERRRTLAAEITARSTGRLFLYVNDAVLMLPGLTNLLYANNLGSATLKVERIGAPPPPAVAAPAATAALVNGSRPPP